MQIIQENASLSVRKHNFTCTSNDNITFHFILFMAIRTRISRLSAAAKANYPPLPAQSPFRQIIQSTKWIIFLHSFLLKYEHSTISLCLFQNVKRKAPMTGKKINKSSEVRYVDLRQI